MTRYSEINYCKWTPQRYLMAEFMCTVITMMRRQRVSLFVWQPGLSLQLHTVITLLEKQHYPLIDVLNTIKIHKTNLIFTDCDSMPFYLLHHTDLNTFSSCHYNSSFHGLSTSVEFLEVLMILYPSSSSHQTSGRCRTHAVFNEAHKQENDTEAGLKTSLLLWLT